MMLTWNEIRRRAVEFSKEWEEETRESAEAKSFWDSFFNIFGISRRRVASFEKPVEKLGGTMGFIDLFWKGTLIVEHKSKGKSLTKAYNQALDYFSGLKEYELPKYVLVSDFSNFRLYDLDDDLFHEFSLRDLHNNIHLFDFILGHTKQRYKDEDPVNARAAEMMGKLHDSLQEDGYSGHALEVFLVRLMFCLFADDTGIFQKDLFSYYIKSKTKEDGTDVGIQLSLIFQTLNTPPENRQKNIDEDLNLFPYVNGSLFKETLPSPYFNNEMRKALLDCCEFNWSLISPAIFGALFQSVMDKKKRKDLGAHYTSERNILKVIKALFMDEFWDIFNSNKNNKKKLEELLIKIRNVKILDPACGCGNFLVISYRELRLLELELIKQINKLEQPNNAIQMVIDIEYLDCLDVDSMYGIEIEEFPARIAEVALWLVDHQMNMKLSAELGKYFLRLPLKKTPNIFHQNALRLEWSSITNNNKSLSYIIGNPPFVSKNDRSKNQNDDMDIVFAQYSGYKTLDYVCAWYLKASDFIQNTSIKVAFVSTNSIAQGEQAGLLWRILSPQNISIHFVHRTFKWNNEAKRNAAVFVIIIGFAAFEAQSKYIYDYETPVAQAVKIKASNINPYLFDFKNVFILSRKTPICAVPQMVYGSKPVDNGCFLFTNEEKNDFLKKEPEATNYIKPFISAREFLNGTPRWCLWLKNTTPSEIKAMPEVNNRVKNIKEFRLQSRKKATQELASVPYLFGEIRQPISDYIVIPLHTSEQRKYIPCGFITDDSIVSNSCSFIEHANLYHFGVLMSYMHMAWVKVTCGRIKSDYRYSNNIVYNNFPWPGNPSENNIKKVERAAKKVLEVRAQYPNESLANLYDPLLMPKKLINAHKDVDRAVDLCYRPQPFTKDSNRLEFLFTLYNKYTTD